MSRASSRAQSSACRKCVLTKVVNSWTCYSKPREFNQTQSSFSSFKANMYAKLLFQHNNMGGPSVGLFGSKISLGEPRIFDRRKYFSQLYLQAKMSAGGYLRMSRLSPHERKMLCDYCNQEASLTCSHCRLASYCCTEHRKNDWKLHRRKCMGQPTTRTGTHFTRMNSYNVMDFVQNSITEQAKSVVETLRDKGYCYIDDFHGDDIARKILSEVKSLHQDRKFTDGELVSSNGNGSTLNKKIRDDKIAWIDGKEDNCETISFHMNAVNLLIRNCNALIEEYDIEHRTKAMVACYPGLGSGYKRHVDNPNEDGRCITTLYYLNPGWTEERGGMLKLYPGGGEEYVKILPKLDRLLLFWSDRRNPHEVEPSHDVRYAITLWYFDKSERARFRKRQESLASREANTKNNEKVKQDESTKEDREAIE